MLFGMLLFGMCGAAMRALLTTPLPFEMLGMLRQQRVVLGRHAADHVASEAERGKADAGKSGKEP